MVADQTGHLARERDDEQTAESTSADESERFVKGTLRRSELVGKEIELPTPCGKHVVYYPAILARHAHQRQSCAVFASQCECGRRTL